MNRPTPKEIELEAYYEERVPAVVMEAWNRGEVAFVGGSLVRRVLGIHEPIKDIDLVCFEETGAKLLRELSHYAIVPNNETSGRTNDKVAARYTPEGDDVSVPQADGDIPLDILMLKKASKETSFLGAAMDFVESFDGCLFEMFFFCAAGKPTLWVAPRSLIAARKGEAGWKKDSGTQNHRREAWEKRLNVLNRLACLKRDEA